MAHWSKNPISILLLTLLAALAWVHFPLLGFSQEKGVGQVEDQRIPSIHVSPPKARLHGIGIDPDNPHKYYLATAQGMQASENGGVSWNPIAVGGKHEEVFALVVHPWNPDILFVGRRDGLWRSRNGGRSWDSLPYPGSVPLALAIAKSRPDVLYVATARSGIHKTTDGGYRWREASTGLPEARGGGRPEEIRSMAVDSLDSNTVYAAIARYGIYRTTDGGGSWHEFNQGLPFPIARQIHPPKIAYDPNDAESLYLAFNQPIHSHLIRTRLYVLSDNDEWHPVEADLPSNFPVLGLVVDGTRRVIQLWGTEAVWEILLPAKSGSNR
jgi:hypothetical protein